MSLAIRPRGNLLGLLRTQTHQERAALDRYGIVRKFFLTQAWSRPPTISALRISWTTKISTRPLHTRNIYAFRCTGVQLDIYGQHRAFHSSHRATDEQKQGQAPRHKDDDKKSSIDEKPVTSTHHEPQQYSRFFRQLAESLPHLHRPTRDDFLNAAGGFWQRMRVRFKWLTIRSFRKYNADDISAFITWFFFSQTLWLLVGTTSFFAVVFAVINSLRLQEYVARAVSDYLTSATGITIFFESAIVPKWRDSRISFKNVYVTRRPDNAPPPKADQNAGHNAAMAYDVSNHPAIHGLSDEEEDVHVVISLEEDTNYTMFDLTVDSIDVTLSLARWLEGKGLVTDAVVKGVRGVVDRRFVHWDPEHPWDPAAFRHLAQPGDFELDSLQLEDVLVSVYQPGNFRPYTASIFRADIRTFRKQWMFYDFMSAENVVGQFDNCLFSLHKPQSIGRTTEEDLKDGQWARMARFRIDGVNIDHLQSMTTEEGPISWITSGKVDAVLDFKFPRDPHNELPFNALIEEIADVINTASTTIAERIPGQRQLAKPPLSAPSDQIEVTEVDSTPKVIMDIDLRFRDLKAAVPIFTNDLSYTSNAFIRPIVAFMNANRTLVPIQCRVAKDLNEFDGAWTMWETGLMDAIAIKVYEAMAYHVTQANFNRRIKAVSAWSLQMTASAILSALRTMTDPLAARLRALYAEGFPYDTVVLPVGALPSPV